jgi:hypothetical protein
VDRDALPERWERPFQEKVTLSISKEKRSLQSPKYPRWARLCRTDEPQTQARRTLPANY